MAFQKTENHAYFVTIHFVHYNFVRIHKSLRMTPAMAARVTDKLRSIADMVKLIENRGALRDGTLLAGAALNENNFARYMDPVRAARIKLSGRVRYSRKMFGCQRSPASGL